MPQVKKSCRHILEKSGCHVAHLMAFNSRQFETNHHRDLLKNMVRLVIPFGAILSVMLQAVSEINFDHPIINSIPNREGVK
jgi:hypothetical protein